ncbi:adenylyltransferase/cytidyltransferase family protein [Candidatus Nomurabacteria bacterium]|nr:adenylyltransferase/cytidyltransferase family protein [Candidatus Nomurabacteria bacterium]
MQRVQKKGKKKVVMVSGGFDPVHIGHVRLFEEAKKLGDELVVYLNNDNWLRRKKGYAFMSEHERKEIIEAFKAVDRVIISSHKENTEDMSVCMGLIKIRPHVFANGGDRDEKDADDPESSLYKERQIHKRLGIKMVYNVGHGGKVRSSSELVKKAKELAK